MMNRLAPHVLILLSALLAPEALSQQQPAGKTIVTGPVARFALDGDTKNSAGTAAAAEHVGTASYVRGLSGNALRLRADDAASKLSIVGLGLDKGRARSFSVQFWVRTTADASRRMVLLSQKAYPTNSLAAQKEPGWVFYMSNGTWAWNIGAGRRRVTYERDNGEHEPLNDGRWHQLTMTYDRQLGQVWLYFDGVQRAIYNLDDNSGFEFATSQPMHAGWHGAKTQPAVAPTIPAGAELLQEFVDTFNAIGLAPVTSEEFVRLVVEPKRLFRAKARARAVELGDKGEEFLASMNKVDLQPVARIESQLMRNPHTVHQAFSFMEAAPLMKLYSLVDGKVQTNMAAAKMFSERERLQPSDFDLDDLSVWHRALTENEVQASYAAHFAPTTRPLTKKCTSLTTGVWNIFHGGLHFTTREHGWDSRVAIAQIIEREQIDVVMMQETYSAGDFIAAELGYHFATTVDWDYLNQGANISILSRYPIREVRVPGNSAFSNVAARISISETQDVWVMSNWYGMNKFNNVTAFHKERFAASDTTPVFFGGDFNAIPHTDGGKSPASVAMLEFGFTDAFRSMYPDVAKHPGYSHRSDRRIDQLYFKGAALQHTSTRVISTWPTGFPSDHYLIRSHFEIR